MITIGEIERVLRERGLMRQEEGMEEISHGTGKRDPDEAAAHGGAESQEDMEDSRNQIICGGDEKTQIRWLTCDSRAVVSGTLFICKGAAFREEYLREAAEKGSIAYISEQEYAAGRGLTAFLVSDVRRAMAAVSALFFGYTPGEPRLTGITGTKGKTTTAWYLKAMLDAWEAQQGEPETGLISTVSNYDGKRRQDAVMTTPEAPVVHELLANARQAGLRYMTMEVSSQALKYKRVRELCFDVGIFLNISEDHISPQEHRDFGDYFSSKLSMFRQTKTACVNLDADHAQKILDAARKAERVVTFGRYPDADYRYSEVDKSGNRISFRVTCERFSERFELAMRGSFNVENAVAAIAAADVYGVPVGCMRQALAQTTVPGRMETFTSGDGKICGIVDFAHNRLSFEKLFDAAYQEYGRYGRIITIFGCPGGKALNRRRELGIIAGLFSDCVCVTSDDPGTECQEDIASEVRGYVEMTGCMCKCIPERAEAVRAMIGYARAQKGKSLILLLGRGSEKYQRFGESLREYPTDSVLMSEALGDFPDKEKGSR